MTILQSTSQIAIGLEPIIDVESSTSNSNYTLPSGTNIKAGQRVRVINTSSTTGIVTVQGADLTVVGYVYPSTDREFVAMQDNPAVGTNWNMQSRFKSPTQTTFLSGSGTYTPPSGVTWLRIRMVGGGGGGSSGGGTSSGGSNGGNSTFGSSLLTAGGGTVATYAAPGSGTGGSFTINSPAFGFGIVGATGSPFATTTANTGTYQVGGNGGSSVFGGAGAGGTQAAGSAANSNSGSGGGGGALVPSASNPVYAGGGGGAGGYVDALITAVVGSYAYSVGTGGSGQTGGAVGGAGGNGIIVIEEHYSG